MGIDSLGPSEQPTDQLIMKYTYGSVHQLVCENRLGGRAHQLASENILVLESLAYQLVNIWISWLSISY